MDKLIIGLDNALRTLFAAPASGREVPGNELPEGMAQASSQDKKHAAALMRVNHSGEISAQALYVGQMLTERDPRIRELLAHAAREEQDHLAWCEKRIEALGDRKSLLNPVWYAGSFALGAATGLLGHRWNLGFVAETERQVDQHIAEHLERLPAADAKSRAVLEQMKADEAQHEAMATREGGRELPAPVKLAMALTSKIMTKTAYWL